MIFTNEEMSRLQTILESQSGLDEVLLERCGPLIHMGKFDEAVRSAFALLEDRLRAAINKDGMSGTNMANHAFNAEGVLAKRLRHTKNERDGLRELYSGAFKLFRNPTAHGVVGYGEAEGKSIIGLVNLLLIILDRAVSSPPLSIFIPPVEKFIEDVDKEIAPSVANRLRAFLGKCKKIGLIDHWARKKLPFRSYALQNLPGKDKPKKNMIAVFYLIADQKHPALLFPVNQYYKRVVDLDISPIADRLRELGFSSSIWGDYYLNLRNKNDQSFFDELYDLVAWIEDDFSKTLP